jgi:hypothetical protein
MNPENMSADQWTEQQHAEAVEALQHAGTYVLAVVTEQGIKILDGSPGEAGTCSHSQLCLYSMLEGWAKTHRKLIEKQMMEVSNEN